MKPIRLIDLMLAACAIMNSGCVESPLSWLPDSSGFLFVKDEHPSRATVHHYDLAKKTQRLVMNVEERLVSNLAIHPDGRRFALLTKADKKPHILSIRDMKGKELHRSADLVFPAQRYDTVTVHWLSKKDQVWLGLEKVHALYDWKAQHMDLKHGGGAWPALFGSVLQPDEKGYVVKTGEEEHLFLDHEDRERAFKIPVDALGGGEPLRWPRFQWAGDALKVRVQGSVVLDVDTAKGTTKRLKPEDRLAKAFDLNPEKGAVPVDIFTFVGEEACLVLLTTRAKEPRSQVLFHRFADKKNKALLDDCRTALFFPAPDGKHVAVMCVKADGRDAIVIVNQEGAVHDEVHLGPRS